MARDIGTSVFNAQRKPDGTTLNKSPFPSHLSKGQATRLTADQFAKATDEIQSGKSTSFADPNKPVTIKKNLENIIPNPLEAFASYTPLWTMACLTKEQFNDPRSYRNNESELKNIVFSSGGRFDSQRVKNAAGTPEFYVNDFSLRSSIAANAKSGNSNVFKIEFEVFEPYSMGQFLQSLQNSAVNSGFANYLNNAPYVLRLDFKGYKETGELITSIKPKFFTMKIVTVRFNTTESGSVYKVEAVPYSHQGFSDVTNITYNDLKIVSGQKGTVEEILRSGPESLASVLNRIEEKLVVERQIGVADIYDIQFPEDSTVFYRYNQGETDKGATQDPNEKITNPTVDTRYVPSMLKGTTPQLPPAESINVIGNADLGFDQTQGGNYAFKKHGDVEENGKINRDRMTIDPKKRTFQFAQSQTLTAIINQIILSSKYARDAMDPKKLTPEGHIKWFRLDVQIELLDFDPIVGDYARKITFRVVPFLVHHSIFSNPNSMPVGYQEIQRKISKEYNYIYTGQNTDVLSFDIQINNLFFAGANSSNEGDSGNLIDQNQQGTAENLQTKTEKTVGPASGSQLANLGRARTKRDPEALTRFKGGNAGKSSEQLVAESFQRAFINGSSGDLVTVQLEILGDPYWLVDSGVNNYFAGATDPSAQITSDGTMNYESGTVYTYITFRSPIDLNDVKGTYDFQKTESEFTGIYRVTACDNDFKDGKFIQRLSCVRMPAQPSDFADGSKELQDLPADKNTALQVSFTKEQEARVTVTDPIIPNILTGTGSVSRKVTETNPIIPDHLRS